MSEYHKRMAAQSNEFENFDRTTEDLLKVTPLKFKADLAGRTLRLRSGQAALAYTNPSHLRLDSGFKIQS
jgi:hypothetical protein